MMMMVDQTMREMVVVSAILVGGCFISRGGRVYGRLKGCEGWATTPQVANTILDVFRC